MSVLIKAPYPSIKTTTILPNPELGDTRATQSTLQIKRTATGRVIAHPKTSDKETLTLTFSLSRMKSAELDAFVESYHYAVWKVTLHDGTEWVAEMVGPLNRQATGRRGVDTTSGLEQIATTLTLSATRIN